MSESVSREVVITLKVVADKASAAASKTIESKVQAAAKAQEESHKKSHSAIDKESNHVARNRIKLLGKIERENEKSTKL